MVLCTPVPLRVLVLVQDEHPDHCVVIKYVPHVGDSKRAMDEYCSEIFMGGSNTIIMHNTCEDSLLAAPIILDLILVTELFSRIKVQALLACYCLPFHCMLPALSLVCYLVSACCPQNRTGAGRKATTHLSYTDAMLVWHTYRCAGRGKQTSRSSIRCCRCCHSSSRRHLCRPALPL